MEYPIEYIYIVIAVIAAVVGCFVYIRYIKNGRDKSEPGEAISPMTDSRSEPPNDITFDNKTIDQQYADTHRMWICMYCETMNKYPAGMEPTRKTVEPPMPLSSEAKSGLRGDLLNRVNTSRSRSASTSDFLTCIACGKQQ